MMNSLRFTERGSLPHRLLGYFGHFRDVLVIIKEEKPSLIWACILNAVLEGITLPLSVWATGNALDLGLQVAEGSLPFADYLPWLFLFLISMLAIPVFPVMLSVYLEPESMLIFRSSHTSKMLQKLKRIRYSHYEDPVSIEIMEKAYGRAEEAALHLFPTYFSRLISSSFSLIGLLYLFGSVQWWFLLTLLLPFALDVFLNAKNSYNIYDEMESYWEREHEYSVLAEMLRSRAFLLENKLLDASDHLIDLYRTRLHKRNREFEGFYFKYLKKHFWGQNLAKVNQLLNAVLLLLVFVKTGMGIGQLISLTTALFTTFQGALDRFGGIIKWSGHQIKSLEYYDKYFDLSESVYGSLNELPTDLSITFEDVCFAYPGTDKNILEHLSFHIPAGQKVSLVGENGQGKTTLIKLLLGFYTPDRGRILLGGIPLQNFTGTALAQAFGVLFQDYNRYDLTLQENIGVGKITDLDNSAAIDRVLSDAKAHDFAQKLPQGQQTLLGRSFDGGVDLSGGQWQRVAIARTLLSQRPVLILDEPTAQLDPSVESEIYLDFAHVASGKTVLFVSHRLSATAVTDRILVLSDGKILQDGTHKELMRQSGLYSEMFQTQKQWYEKAGGSYER